jgi:hypothetical protein
MRKWVKALASASAALSWSTPSMPAAAQDGPPARTTIETARLASAVPIECWWRASLGSVRVGELFSVVLTCGVLENDAVRVVVDQARFGAAALQVAPFEIVSSRHGTDLRTRERRFFQYEYQLRLMADDLFGRDVKLPETTLSYRIESRTPSGGALEGRELAYTLPLLSIRVLSLVPAEASDIREASSGTFSDVDRRTFYANVLLVSSGTLLALGTVVLLAAVLRAAAERRRTVTGPHLLSDTAILRGVARHLAAVRLEREKTGWSSALIARALGALRVAAAYAVSQPIVQVATDTAAVEEGTLVVRSRWFVPGRVRVSASVTGPLLLAELRATPASRTLESTRVPIVEALAETLACLTSAQYGETAADPDDLDAALASGVRALARFRRDAMWTAVKQAAFRRPRRTIGSEA